MGAFYGVKSTRSLPLDLFAVQASFRRGQGGRQTSSAASCAGRGMAGRCAEVCLWGCSCCTGTAHGLSSMQVLQARLCNLSGSHMSCDWSAQSSHIFMINRAVAGCSPSLRCSQHAGKPVSRQMLVLEVDATWCSIQEGPCLQHMHSSRPLLPAASPPLWPARLPHRDSSRSLATCERSRSQSQRKL